MVPSPGQARIGSEVGYPATSRDRQGKVNAEPSSNETGVGIPNGPASGAAHCEDFLNPNGSTVGFPFGSGETRGLRVVVDRTGSRRLASVSQQRIVFTPCPVTHIDCAGTVVIHAAPYQGLPKDFRAYGRFRRQC